MTEKKIGVGSDQPLKSPRRFSVAPEPSQAVGQQDLPIRAPIP